MEHAFIDEYAELDSIIHKLDPRVKIVSFFSLVFLIIFTSPTEFLDFLFFFLFIFMIILISKIPISFVFKRSLIILPFIAFVAIFMPFLKEGEVAGSYNLGSLHFQVTYSGLLVLWNVLIKSWLSVLCMIILTSTTKFNQLLKGFQRLGMPKIIIMILSFFYRYVFILIDEAMRMKRARDSRSFKESNFAKLKSTGNIIACLFIRAYERGERVYQAMVSRGFNGEIKNITEFKFSTKDLGFIMVLVIYVAMVKLWV